MILPIWQPQGFSTHIIAKKVAEKLGVKTSHTGTLDPMAEGVIIVLVGEDRFKKYDYAHWLKTYEFEILLGISTDTYDGLGMITTISNSQVIQDKLENTLAAFIGPYRQEVPVYSAIKVKGKHLHQHARSKTKVKLPIRSGELLALKLLELRTESKQFILETLESKISKITGDFRQQKVLNQWQNYKFKAVYQLARVEVTMTKGLYVRSLVTDIASKLNFSAFAFSITRTGNGNYTKQNAKTLEEVFGNNYLNEYDFYSKSASSM